MQARFAQANNLAIAIRDKMTKSRKELINILTNLEVLKKYSMSVGLTPTNDSSLSSGSVSRQQSEIT